MSILDLIGDKRKQAIATATPADFANTCQWLDFLYGDCNVDDGWIVIVSNSKNKISGAIQAGSKDRLIEAARIMHRNPGCYLKINLMDYEAMMKRSDESGKFVVGNSDEVKTIVSLHLDLDANKDAKYVDRTAAMVAINSMPLLPTLLVNSDGNCGGFHAYWKLKSPIRIDSIETRDRMRSIGRQWNGRLKFMFRGDLDSTFNIDRVLRCVGVPRLSGGKVCIENYDPSRLYEPEDFI